MTLRAYVSRLFLSRFLFCLVTLAALLQLLDLLDNASDALRRGGFASLATYGALRFPSVINQLVPISVLLGALMTLVGLAQSNEIVAMRSTGLTVYRLVGFLVPATLAIALGHLILGDQVAPRAERRFQDWWTAGAPRSDADEDRPSQLWLRNGSDIVAVDRVATKGRSLDGVRVFHRDRSGNLAGETAAAHATHGADGWALLDARSLDVRRSGITASAPMPRLAWDTPLTPADFVELTTPTDALSMTRLVDILSGRRPASAGEAFYRTRLQRKFAFPLASVVMLLVAAPAALGTRRHGNLSTGLGLGLAAGFLFLIGEGLMLAAGQAGLLPSALAAWAPTLFFASLAGAFLIYLEDK